MDISKEFKNLSIKVVDSEGEFLLIESADCLPLWIGPENSENRVWIRNGSIHIIPPEEVGSNKHGGIKISQAISTLQRSNTSIAVESIQRCIRNRTSDIYPGKALASEFTAVCYVPSNVASLLQNNPNLLTIAVDSFCSTDKNNSKYMASMSLFERDLKLEEMITVPIRFTRALYAQLSFKQYHPPKKFHKIMNTINASCPDTEVLRLVKKSFDIGSRLTVGLEIAYQKSRADSVKNESKFSERLHEDDFISKLIFSNRIKAQCDPLFTNSLKEKYSKGHIVLSRINNFNIAGQISNEHTDRDILKDDIMGEYDITPIHSVIGNHLANRASNPSSTNIQHAKLGDGDDESWLYMSPEDFEKEMNDRIKNIGATIFKTELSTNATNEFNSSNENQSDNDQSEMKNKIDQLNEIVQGVKKFMSMKSTIDGVDLDNQDDNETDEMYSHIDNLNFKDIMEQLLKISNNYNEGNNEIKLDEYFSSDDDEDGDNDHDTNNSDNYNNDNSNNKVKEKISKHLFNEETLHGIKNVIFPNSANDDESTEGKDSDDEDSFYNDNNICSDDSDDELGKDSFDYNNDNNLSDFMEEYSKYMDAELSSTTLAESFEKTLNSEDDSADDVDVEKNLLKYLMESHASQLGLPGPASQLLSQLNLSLPLPPPMNSKQ